MTTAAASAGAGGGSSHDCITFPVGCFTGGSSKVLVGYTAGGGLEYAAWSNVTFKVEYLYVNLGSSDTKVVAHPLGANPPTSFNAHFSDLHFNVVRFGANYRFLSRLLFAVRVEPATQSACADFLAGCAVWFPLMS
jgi:outer membrane immunogenic protein